MAAEALHVFMPIQKEVFPSTLYPDKQALVHIFKTEVKYFVLTDGQAKQSVVAGPRHRRHEVAQGEQVLALLAKYPTVQFGVHVPTSLVKKLLVK
jgi:hypothetical protein